MRDTYVAVITHCGGEDAISELEKLSARRIGCLEAELVHLEDKFAKARAAGNAPATFDIDLYSRVSNTWRRHCESIGWQRRPKDVTSLASYLSDRAASAEPAHAFDASPATIKPADPTTLTSEAPTAANAGSAG